MRLDQRNCFESSGDVESGGLGQGNFLVFNNLEVILGE